MTHHGVWDDGRPDMAFSSPRCPRCTSWRLAATSERWWCHDCDLVVTCTRTEWDAMATQRAQWAAGQHPAQQPAPTPPERTNVPHDHARCQVCGGAHAIAPDHRAPRPRTDQRDGARRWDTPRPPPPAHDPDGHTLAWPHGTRDEPYEEPAAGALDPIAAEARLLADMDDHDLTRRTA